MKTSVLEQLLGHMPTVDDIIRDTISNGNEDAFYVLDVQDILRKHKNWLLKMPRVRPYYAVKCNSSPIILELLAALGLSFDCASKTEIDKILGMGVRPNNIIYANPCKTKSFIKHAANVAVDLMTFDNEQELYKVRQLHPNAAMVIRIKVDDSHSVCRLGLKFGADMDKVAHLLEVAKTIGVNVVGVSFHVGSGCESVDAYSSAIANAKYIFDLGKEFGFDMTLLDIGGGFPGTSGAKVSFDEIARVVNESLDIHFPAIDEYGIDTNVDIIAEPGRYYVASAFTLATLVIAKRPVPIDDGQTAMMYYLNDGVYGSFNCTIFDHWDVEPVPMLDNNPRESYMTTIWGPTCDSMDCIKRNVQMPEMFIGEWILFREMGAYTICAASTFNGFEVPLIKYYVPSYTLEMLEQLPSWPRIAAILNIQDEVSSIDAFDVDHHMEVIPVH